MRGQALSMVRQCELLDINRSSLYCKSKGISPEDEEIMKKIDRIHMKYPFKGSRKIVYALGKMEGVEIGRKRVRRLMGIMGIRGLAPGPLTTRRGGVEHRIYPYLLRGKTIERCGQVWAAADHVYSDEQGFCVSGVCNGLVFAEGVELEGIEHNGYGVLRGGFGGSALRVQGA